MDAQIQKDAMLQILRMRLANQERVDVKDILSLIEAELQ
jgi:hypothetical protein